MPGWEMGMEMEMGLVAKVKAKGGLPT